MIRRGQDATSAMFPKGARIEASIRHGHRNDTRRSHERTRHRDEDEAGCAGAPGREGGNSAYADILRERLTGDDLRRMQVEHPYDLARRQQEHMPRELRER